jgi:2-C-methyl-D-erythritol 2,4-cyclodiphosphate synthase
MNLRIGQGLDVHAFGPGDHVMLGGVRIAHDQGLIAHSDGDVLLHALCDALLGAAALGDIGHHFPPSDARWAGADSRDLLRRVAGLLAAAGWDVVNIDATVVCEQPRLADHVETMRRNMASDLGLDISKVSVKATTTERLGFCGRQEGIAASVVTLLGQRPAGGTGLT